MTHRIRGNNARISQNRVREQPSSIFLSSHEAAAYLKISLSTLYKFCSAGKIPYYKPGGKLLLFLKEDLDRFAMQNRIPSNDELLE